jgi:hypothetical protein
MIFATTIRMFPGVVARSMLQLGCDMLVYTRRSKASCPGLPGSCTHHHQLISFRLPHSILFRGPSIDVVWPEFLAIALIGDLFFGLYPALSPSGRSDRVTISAPDCRSVRALSIDSNQVVSADEAYFHSGSKGAARLGAGFSRDEEARPLGSPVLPELLAGKDRRRLAGQNAKTLAVFTKAPTEEILEW